uniref:Uncharacterized protein n=1 Tax=Anguilla anguilla TaxID=7936 RepID=A0A0E9SR22_ANGAN
MKVVTTSCCFVYKVVEANLVFIVVESGQLLRVGEGL